MSGDQPPRAAQGSARGRVWLLLAVVLLLAAALIAVLLWPRGPELVPYVSPPLDASGARLHMLVPRGWVVHFHAPGQAEGAPPGVTAGLINVAPPDPWLARSLRRWLPHPDEADGSLTIAITRSPRRLDTPDYYDTAIGAQDRAGRITFWLAFGGRQLPDHVTYVNLYYYHGSKATLDRTAPAILRSLRVER